MPRFTPNPALVHELVGRVLALEQKALTIKASERRHMNSSLRAARMSLARAKGTHTEAEWEAIVAETGGICVRCGYQHPDGEQPAKGHIVPLFVIDSPDATDSAENLMPLCKRCTTARKDEGIDWLAYWRETHGPVPAMALDRLAEEEQ